MPLAFSWSLVNSSAVKGFLVDAMMAGAWTIGAALAASLATVSKSCRAAVISWRSASLPSMRSCSVTMARAAS